MNLLELFLPSFSGRAGKTALQFQGRAYTFQEISQRSLAVARGLCARGVRRGERLAVYLPNCVEFIDLYLACLRLGAIFVPINILYRVRELRHILADAQPVGIVSRCRDLPGGVQPWAPEDLYHDGGDIPFDADLTEESPAALVYTSGTTGASKGAVLTHANFAANAHNLIQSWRISESDRLLLPLPLFHVHGLGNGLHCWLASGCTLRLLERFDHRQAAAEFQDFEPTLFFGVPTMYVRLLEIGEHEARAIGARMRLFVSGSAPLPAAVLEQFRDLFGHTILERYGMTETLMNISNPYEGERRPGTVGLPLPGVQVRLVKPDGTEAAPGEVGEIYLKGPNVFAGYWRREDATREAFENGWFRTGDLASRSSDGYYTLCGRKSDLIISGGFNIYPREIEEFLLEQPEVAEAAVVGVPDRLRGEVPVAYIVARANIDPAALSERCRRHLASFKVPKEFFFVDKLPRNALGKVQKHLLVAARPGD